MKTKRLLFSALLALLPGSVLAQNYSFSCVTNSSAANCTVGGTQLQLTVTAGAGGSTDFRFTNTGPLASSITDIYFDWAMGTYNLDGGNITDSGAGVSFAWGATPPNLPGGNSIGFVADKAADSNTPVQPMGVNPGEWVNFNFNRDTATLLAGLNSNQLRVGLHVQGFQDGGSESFVGAVVTPVPEPETYAMLLAGLGLMGFVARRRRARFAAS